MGIPRCTLKWAPKGRAGECSQQAENTRCSLIGNSFHVPIVAFQLCSQAAAIAPASHVGLEAHIRSHARGTVWQPDLLEEFPGLLKWAHLEAVARKAFIGLPVDLPLDPPRDLDRALARLQCYWVDTQLRRLPGDSWAHNGGNRNRLRTANAPWANKRAGPTPSTPSCR